MSKKLTSDEIRKRFLKFFEKRGHTIVPSAPLVPRLDKTLLFTNAGMNQFKKVFTGEETRDYKKATSTQKCVRAGGKHNDLENVGHTGRHHTFFEMLGNFSFGDYFKKDAIIYGWDFVTKEVGLSKDRLYASVYQDDDEAFDIWKKEIGLSEERIFRFGKKDNFWAMGDIGPCGPCSEIFYDQGAEISCGKADCTVGCECDRYVEVWNLVFMQFEQKSDGTRAPLPKPSIDTGMGLERLAAVVQGVSSNYDTDLFAPLLRKVGKQAGITYEKADEQKRISMRVTADHIRAMTFLITDGVRPSNEGRGYVLRRIMRRAMRHGRKLGLHKPFLYELSKEVVKLMGKAFPELKKGSSSTSAMIKDEEERFAQTIDRGMALLQEEIDRMARSNNHVLSGEIAFKLYETYGFPVDLTADVLRENYLTPKGELKSYEDQELREGNVLTYDYQAFEEAFAKHRELARGSWKGSGQSAIDSFIRKWAGEGVKTTFLGYDLIESEGKVLFLVKKDQIVKEVEEGDEVELVADQTPFYGEAGGQVGDIGTISGEGFSLEVIDTQKPSPDILVHRCIVREGKIKTGQKALFAVNEKARLATAKNHTATHILHAALREILGSEIKQEGSLVSPERLRFDFTHPHAVTGDQLTEIEKIVNERIWLDSPVKKELLPLEKALQSGAVALFDEKYGKSVRVISLDEYSKELCGGTHLDRSGEIGIFKIVKESAIAAGVRRIEAYTGHRALRYVEDNDRLVRSMGNRLGVSGEMIAERIEKLLQKQKDLEKEIKRLKASPGGAAVTSESEKIVTVSGIKLLMAEAEGVDHQDLRTLADRSLEKLKSGVVAVVSKNNGKAFLVIKVSKDLSKRLKAGDIIKEPAKILGGSGGGRPEMAQAGGSSVDQIPAALAEVRASVEKLA